MKDTLLLLAQPQLGRLKAFLQQSVSIQLICFWVANCGGIDKGAARQTRNASHQFGQRGTHFVVVPTVGRIHEIKGRKLFVSQCRIAPVQPPHSHVHSTAAVLLRLRERHVGAQQLQPTLCIV